MPSGALFGELVGQCIAVAAQLRNVTYRNIRLSSVSGDLKDNGRCLPLWPRAKPGIPCRNSSEETAPDTAVSHAAGRSGPGEVSTDNPGTIRSERGSGSGMQGELTGCIVLRAGHRLRAGGERAVHAAKQLASLIGHDQTPTAPPRLWRLALETRPVRETMARERQGLVTNQQHALRCDRSLLNRQNRNT